MNPVVSLAPTKDGLVNAVIETPQGSRNKYAFDEEAGLFRLHRVLPAGSHFPYSFGFIPRTLAEDGDPLDVLVLADEPVPVGCIVPARLIGIMVAEQNDGQGKEHNDRLIAVAAESRDHERIKSLVHLAPSLRKEIERFFAAYHEQAGENFKIVASRGPVAARQALRKAAAEFERSRS